MEFAVTKLHPDTGFMVIVRADDMVSFFNLIRDDFKHHKIKPPTYLDGLEKDIKAGDRRLITLKNAEAV